MDRREADWLQRIKGKDVAGILQRAGMPCTGTLNYIPQFEDGYEADVKTVMDLIAGKENPVIRKKAKRPRSK